MAGYYAFLLLELAAIEKLFEIPALDEATALVGAERGAVMQSGSTIEQRYEWMSHFIDTRALFAPREA